MTTNVEKQIVYQGDTSRIFRVKLDQVDISISTCRFAVRANPADSPVIEGSITNTESINGVNYFQAVLTPDQTAQLGTGNWIWGIEVESTGTIPPHRRELHIDLEIKNQVVANG